MFHEFENANMENINQMYLLMHIFCLARTCPTKKFCLCAGSFDVSCGMCYQFSIR